MTIDTSSPLTEGDVEVLDLLLRHGPATVTVTTIPEDDGFEQWLEGNGR